MWATQWFTAKIGFFHKREIVLAQTATLLIILQFFLSKKYKICKKIWKTKTFAKGLPFLGLLYNKLDQSILWDLDLANYCSSLKHIFCKSRNFWILPKLVWSLARFCLDDALQFLWAGIQCPVGWCKCPSGWQLPVLSKLSDFCQ